MHHRMYVNVTGATKGSIFENAFITLPKKWFNVSCQEPVVTLRAAGTDRMTGALNTMSEIGLNEKFNMHHWI
jgi:hypothetical protein